MEDKFLAGIVKSVHGDCFEHYNRKSSYGYSRSANTVAVWFKVLTVENELIDADFAGFTGSTYCHATKNKAERMKNDMQKHIGAKVRVYRNRRGRWHVTRFVE